MIRFYLMAIGLSVMPLLAWAGGADRGEELYRVFCTQCHGISGDGNGINAAHINVQPRSHVEREGMASRSDEDLFRVIKEGGPAVNASVLMPAWKGNLDDSGIHDLVAYLRALCCEE